MSEKKSESKELIKAANRPLSFMPRAEAFFWARFLVVKKNGLRFSLVLLMYVSLN